jgi:hypothetical protein
MKKHYKMNEEVVYRANSYLINSYEKMHQLTPEEENGLVNRFSEELRNGNNHII